MKSICSLNVAWLTIISMVPLAGHVSAAPPLPVHTVEGLGGGAITPMAYLDSPERLSGIFGRPTVTMTYVNMDRKNLNVVSVTETLADLVELGYAANRLSLGSLPGDIRDATTVDIDRSDVWLHHFNARVQLLREGSYLGGLPMPAVTAGVQVKVNDGINEIDQKLGGALTGIGYRRSSGVDFALTASKMFQPGLLCNRPLILTGGLRASQGAQLGLFGFGDDYHGTFEGSVAYLPCDWLVLAYEFRQKPDPYAQIPGLIGNEDDWHALDAIFILGEQSAFTAGYGNFGTVANSEQRGVWWLQLHYHF
ncbi:MAG: DUF3034 family protein [Planctomycetes bacterium]|nr:DUF3034 family protein [Planctomycetota bacterium]